MPSYVANALHKFQHNILSKTQHSSSKYIQPNYGAKIQVPIPKVTTIKLEKEAITKIQQVMGTLLFYGRAVDSTMLLALNNLAMEQSKGTEKTAAALMHLPNYAATHPEVKIGYYASDMILYIDSNALYLSLPLGKSRAGGFFYLSKRQTKPKEKSTSLILLNGAVFVLCTRLKHVMASAAEAEVGSLFMNCQESIPI